ncbi:large ribosomal subunit protein uL14m-like isoform X2 [Ruditapes philippinarum]|nr:large ribosomal subunit protein uL14m-like [Ruditapes philippinarum]XP_060555638.1 large ribosomal subunit protein uL14m-like [Ruditapes philippinarum]XP_060555639.1 large ribosomal subunit protein uL14m-like [Ruditapes philippinarum]XP_060568735.1 large ribosomal subunit protein uL14m-like isoform X2 [Ruditapes philippinarum]XP_060568736.1 large ribosomal subunit protein uL14m-like isoform X2 [Ruditapes philippinarum]
MNLCRNISRVLSTNLQVRNISTSCCLKELQKLSTVKVVDNSMMGRKAVLAGKKVKIIHVYNKTSIGRIGDMVKVTIMGEMKKAYIVGCVQKQKPNVPRFDTNNIVLIEENGIPTGTRIRAPIPSCLRGKEGDFTKILSMASKFV